MATSFVSGLVNRALEREGRQRSAVRTARRRGVARMAGRKLEENVPGNFFVDSKCIDCDACRWLAADTFAQRPQGQSFVYKQPESAEDRQRALQAMVACPVGSIRTEVPEPQLKDARSSFPSPVDANLPGVYYNGFASHKSYGASSYLILDEECGATMVDSPRYSSILADQIAKLAPGGVKRMFLTHSDDVADHARWAKRFSLERIIHRNQVRGSTEEAETILEGSGPWPLSSTKTILFRPGHSAGDLVLYDKARKVAFTGDLYAYSNRVGGISGFRRYNHHSWSQQVESMTDITNMDLDWVLPGHGRRIHFENPQMKWDMFQEFLETEGKSARTRVA